jgi:hypothetical protein
MMAGGIGLDPDAQAFLSAAGITDATISVAINTLVIQLKAIGVWTKMKAIYPFVGGTATTHKFNLKDPRDLDAAYRLVFSGGITHSSNGALPNGTNGFADTFLASTGMAQSSIHGSFYSRTNLDANRADLSSGNLSTPGFFGFSLYFRRGGNTQIRINSSNNIQQPVADSFGLILASRTGASTSFIQKNSTQITINDTANNHVNTSIKLFRSGDGAGDFGARQSAFASIGDGLTTTEAANLYTAVQAFQTTLSRQV